MLVRRSVLALSRQAVAIARPTSQATRCFASSSLRRSDNKHDDHDHHHAPPAKLESKMVPFDQVQGPEDLLPTGAPPGTVPTDYEQATGLERWEILGKMQGVDVFDMRPLDSSRTGTPDNPIRVNGMGPEQYAGCTGCPADSHVVRWVVVSRERPQERCDQCGSVYEYNFLGDPDSPIQDPHVHSTYDYPDNFGNHMPKEYWYK